ncbi:CpaF family protein [Myceligenerans indicum]|nr:CpaF/VirB11 family protein [Myceligenerans indicum]
MDWQQVAMFRAQASERLVERLGEDRGKDVAADKETGRKIIRTIIDDAAADLLHDGEKAWSYDEQEALETATYNALFGLGRLQPLIDDETVENIIISGAENVWVETTDGELIRKDPVASSDKELLEELAFVAQRSESNARNFTSAHPRLHMRLDGGSRLAAAAWVTARPSVVIRRHRLRRVSLDDLVARDMLSANQAGFLRAAVKARKSIVVAGPQGAGKTTLVRALCAEIPRHEAIGTFETEFELHLHELPDVHEIVHAWEARPGSGEVGPDGRQAGEFGLDEALYDSFRFNLSRQIVGEVRGAEVWAMIKAMESGAGSISTTHAANGEAAVRKLVTCAMEAGSHVTRELATTKLSETIDLVVQISLRTGQDRQDPRIWRKTRNVSEIVHVAPGEAAKGYATTHVYRSAPHGGPAVPGTLPDELRELEHWGFDLTGFLTAEGQEAGAL